MSTRSSAVRFSLCTLVLAACGSPAVLPAPVDGGTDAYARPDAFRGPDSCDMEHLHVLEGMANGTVGIDFDTTMSDTRPRDLGLGCGNPAGDIRWAPQEVVELHVPGTGMQAVTFTTNNTMTAQNFNTVLQVRTGGCRDVPTATYPFTCFDDVSATNFATRGGITVMGGTTLYVIVTGWSHPPAEQGTVDHGMVHVDFTVAPNTPPTIDSGSVIFADVNVVNTIHVTDAESTLIGYTFRLYTVDGGVDLDGNGTFDAEDQFFQPFESVDATAPTYVAHSFIDGMNEYTFAAYCRSIGCTEWGLSVFDQGYAQSAEVRVPVQEAQEVGIGATCDDTHLCAAGLACTSGACIVTAAATTACMRAQDLVIPTPTTGATSTTVSYNIGTGAGVFEGSCAPTAGKESIYHLVVPAGDYDLLVTTDIPATTSDTVLYVRSACTDGTTELPMGCNDDVMYPSNVQSTVSFRDIAPGDYYVFIEGYGSGGSATPFSLTATLTPVIASGGTCDPALHDYRCATGTCSATTMTCP
ncbi:MAG: hypothetical protein U0234_19405 [Sandaracinus sp.]